MKAKPASRCSGNIASLDAIIIWKLKKEELIFNKYLDLKLKNIKK